MIFRLRFPSSSVWHALVVICICFGPRAAAGQTDAAGDETSLEALAERATRATVLIDVQTPSSTRQGSGFIVESDGLILTNHHVVRDAESARIRMASGDVYDEVVLLAEDPRRDIAVLRVSGFDLPTLPLGNSDSVSIGAPVVLIGSPHGLENTVSTGIVSGRRQEPEGFQLLQVTAPASQGSSGGAVLASNGDVIGIAVSQLVQGQNLNFAVPINYARGMLRNLDTTSAISLRPVSADREDAPPERRQTSKVANRGLSFDLEGVREYVAAWTAEFDNARQRHTRVSYRVIETVSGDAPRIERYLDSETTVRTEPFGTRQTVRRERSRAIVAARDLRPISSRGEIAWWTEEGWETAGHELRFEDDRVVGIITDSTGNTLDLDRSVPGGVLLRDTRDLAFATLQTDSLMGRSVEFVMFDPMSGELAEDRYDIIGNSTIEVAGTERPVIEVNVATGLSNETVYFDRNRPRVAVRRLGEEDTQVEEIVCLDVETGPDFSGRPAEGVQRTAWCLQDPDG